MDEQYYNWTQHFPVDPIECIKKLKLGFEQGNILKYVIRYRHKDGVRDLFKARALLDSLICDELGIHYEHDCRPLDEKIEDFKRGQGLGEG